MGAAILADVSHNKDNEQTIRSQLGVSTLKVWKEVKLFLDPKACQTEEHKLDSVCVDADCKMAWFRDKHFSVSAKVCMAQMTRSNDTRMILRYLLLFDFRYFTF